MTRVRLILAASSLMAVLWLPAAPAAAQCSVGQPLYKGCFNVSWEGCCTIKTSDAGEITTLQWCENGHLCFAICNPFAGQYCSWSFENAIYDCLEVTVSLDEDPSGKNPYLCQIPCGGVKPEGCCEGQTLLKFCKNGSLNLIDCSQNTGANFCGWDPVKQNYTCMASPVVGPEGFPYTCGGGSTTCTPACSGKVCGADGCGGTCGTCPEGWTCDSVGQCQKAACVPSCDGKSCGPDGCGGSCGTCPADKFCTESFTCGSKPCTPSCENKECGADLCGGSCGVCIPPLTCAPWFACVEGGSDLTTTVPDAATVEDGTTSVDPGTGVSPLFCPDGTVQRYGTCVPLPPPSEGSGGCSASGRGDATGALALLAIVLLAFLGLRARHRGGASILWSVVLVAIASTPGCGRRAPESWTPQVELPGLASELTDLQDPEDETTLRLDVMNESERRYRVAVEHGVKIRGRRLPGLVASIDASADLVETIVRMPAGEGPTVRRFLSGEIEASTDPEIAGAPREIEQALALDATFQADASGTLRPLPEKSGVAAPQISPRGLSLLMRLFPALPGDVATAGQHWRFAAEDRKSLPGGSVAVMKLTGQYRFRGMLEKQGRTYAVVDLDYSGVATGDGNADGIGGELTGSCHGSGVYLIDPSDGGVNEGQLIENARLRVDLSEGKKSTWAEQKTRTAYEIRLQEDAS